MSLSGFPSLPLKQIVRDAVLERWGEIRLLGKLWPIIDGGTNGVLGFSALKRSATASNPFEIPPQTVGAVCTSSIMGKRS
jgi:hypothetical protein